MIKPISDLFGEAQAACVQWQGKPLYGLYELEAPDALEIEFLSSISNPVQGLNLTTDGGVMEIAGVEADDMLLWCDTAPPKVPVKIKPGVDGKVILKIWNVWRGKVGGHDVTQAWLGNAGMRIEQSGNQISLRCSDGEGPVSFDDLTARMTIGG
jgi:hypothetical protein